MKRAGFLLLLLLTSAPVFAEAFKNDNPGGILGGLFILAVGAPVAIGFGMYALLSAGEEDYTASKGFTVFASCVGWWVMWGILFNSQPGGGAGFLVLCASAGAAAGAYYLSRQQKPEA